MGCSVEGVKSSIDLAVGTLCKRSIRAACFNSASAPSHLVTLRHTSSHLRSVGIQQVLHLVLGQDLLEEDTLEARNEWVTDTKKRGSVVWGSFLSWPCIDLCRK